jgi:repressor LexA
VSVLLRFYIIVLFHDYMPRIASQDMTPAQERIAHALADLERSNRPGFIAELLKSLRLAAESSLTPTLKKMASNGFIEILSEGVQGRSRIVRLTAKGRHRLGLRGIPVVGRITAGPLREALSEPDEFLDADTLLPHRKGDFLLRVVGDSMIGEGIMDRDLVLLRPNVEVAQGEIAAAYVGDGFEATLKRVYFEREGIRLRAGNPAYADILVPMPEWRGVAGVYRGLVRHVAQ